MAENINKKNQYNIPTINERLGYLRPSRELLEYYRKKIGDYDLERDELLKRLDAFKRTLEDQHKTQWELRQKDDEIAELQKAVSDMQVFLFQEREQVLKLYAENDRLKIQELQDRKKINRLLSLAGVNEHEVTYFIKEPPGKLIINQKHETNNKSSSVKKSDTNHSHSEEAYSTPNATTGKYPRDYESLLLQINSLETQIAEQTKQSREQIDALLEDRKTRGEEFEAQRLKDACMIKELREKLLQTQQLLHESTKDFLELKYSCRQNERRWMHEKDRLLKDLDKSNKHENIKDDEILFVAQEPVQSLAEEERKTYDNEIASLREELKQSHQLSEMYREQVLKLEEEVSRQVEKGDVTRELFKTREDKLSQRLKLCTDRYKELEKRRHMEVEGFKNELKQLREKLRSVEKNLLKARIDKKPFDLEGIIKVDDQEVLRDVHESTVRSREMQGELQHLKAKIYSIENEIRRL